MKKLVVILAVLGLLFLAADASYARGIGIKGGYAIMGGDYADAEIDDTPFFGVFFDAGNFLFNSLKFKPGLDYLTLKGPNDTFEADVWGIHIDWYWHFLGQTAISPFLGFGPALNLYDFKTSHESDSDAGIEGFAGCEFAIAGPFTLIIEARYVIHDIAATDTNMWKLGVGIQYNF
jgi:hypothetical protein